MEHSIIAMDPSCCGLPPVASDLGSDGTDLVNPLPLESIDEDIEKISEDESCPTSNGNFESSATSIDGEVTVLQNSPEKAMTDGMPQLHENLEIQASRGTTSSDPGGSQVNPNSLIYQMNSEAPSLLNSETHEADVDAIFNTGLGKDLPFPISSESMDPNLDTNENHLDDLPATSNSRFKGQWINCKKMSKMASTVDTSQHLWKPKNRSKQYTWQRVPVQRSKPQGSGSTQACINTVESLQPPKALETGESSDPHGRNPAEQEDQTKHHIPGESPQKKDTCDTSQSETECHQNTITTIDPP
ncbi:hypothetical protein Dimus_005177, partial [Dionaea muscipula]